MKILKPLAALTLAAVLLTTSSFAAEFAKSAELQPAPTLVSQNITIDGVTFPSASKVVQGADVNDIWENIPTSSIKITSLNEAKKSSDNLLKTTMTTVENELKNASDLETLIPGVADAWKKITGGAPLSNMVVAEIFDINMGTAYNKYVGNGFLFKTTLRPASVTNKDKILVAHKNLANNKYEILDYQWVANGGLELTSTSNSPYIIFKDSGASPVVAEDAPKSPQTGVNTLSASLVIGSVVFAGAAAAFVVSAKKN